MRYEEVFNDVRQHADIDVRNLLDILDAITKVYPMIVLANLSKNSYSMLKDEGFLFDRVMQCGNYDDMILDGVKNIHPDYQALFLDCFAREALIRRFEHGEKEIEARLYQKNMNGQYHWVIVKVIRVVDESGDLVEVCLNKVLSDEMGDRYGHLL